MKNTHFFPLEPPRTAQHFAKMANGPKKSCGASTLNRFDSPF
jgi:hypothetical protein